MARLLLFLLVFLAIFTMPVCPECEREYKNFKLHAPTCKKLLDALDNGPALKRKHYEEEQERQKRQRRLDEERVAREAVERAEQERRRVCSLCSVARFIAD